MPATDGLANGDGQVETVVARGRLATVTDHRHDPRAGRHRDPGEEVFDRPVVIFSEDEPWSFRSAAGSLTVDGRWALVVAPGTLYQAHHEGRRPQDRSTTIRLEDRATAALAGDVGGSLPTRWLPRAPSLEAARQSLVHAAAAGDVEALDVATARLIDLVGEPSPDGDEARTADEGRQRVADGATWLRANLARELDLVELGRATGTSPFHLSRLFRRHLGLPPFAYLRRVRLERAAELLRAGDRSVTEVCFEAGFGSLSHFVTAFRLTYGVSPGGYRRGRRAA